jgi:hypothetical protein
MLSKVPGFFDDWVMLVFNLNGIYCLIPLPEL